MMKRHEGHGRGTEGEGPNEADCPCRDTPAEDGCARSGCGFCRIQYCATEGCILAADHSGVGRRVHSDVRLRRLQQVSGSEGWEHHTSLIMLSRRSVAGVGDFYTELTEESLRIRKDHHKTKQQKFVALCRELQAMGFFVEHAQNGLMLRLEVTWSNPTVRE